MPGLRDLHSDKLQVCSPATGTRVGDRFRRSITVGLTGLEPAMHINSISGPANPLHRLGNSALSPPPSRQPSYRCGFFIPFALFASRFGLFRVRNFQINYRDPGWRVALILSRAQSSTLMSKRPVACPRGIRQIGIRNY